MEHRLVESAGPDSPRGVVLVLHGGAEHDPGLVGNGNKQLWRARHLFRSISPRLTGQGIAVASLRFSVVGWNATDAVEPAPLSDVRWALDRLRTTYDVPVVLLGHSMGARAAVWSAADPSVVGVVGLAPWFPPDDPVEPLTGRHVVGAHGSRDRITHATATRTFLERAEPVAGSTKFVDRGPVGHYLLRDVRGWNRVAVEESRRILDVSGITRGN